MGIWKESKYRPEYCEVAIEVLSAGKSLAAVCAQIGICRETLTNWKNAHPDFNAAMRFGVQKCQVYWEDMGMDGIQGNIEKFGASPWIFSMKNRFREDYKEEKEDKSDTAVSVLEKIISGELKIKND
jgi:transposase